MTSMKILEVLTLSPSVRKIYVLFVHKFGVIFDPPPPPPFVRTSYVEAL